MRNIVILFISIFFSQIVLAQTGQKKSVNENVKEIKSDKEIKNDKTAGSDKPVEYLDKNGDGINDLLQSAQKRTMRGRRNMYGKDKNTVGVERKKDLFIDEDGDGICDFRAKGMGFGAKNRPGVMGKGQMGKMKNP